MSHGHKAPHQHARGFERLSWQHLPEHVTEIRSPTRQSLVRLFSSTTTQRRFVLGWERDRFTFCQLCKALHTEVLNKLAPYFQSLPRKFGPRRMDAWEAVQLAFPSIPVGFQVVLSITSIHRGGHDNHSCSAEELALPEIREERFPAAGS